MRPFSFALASGSVVFASAILLVACSSTATGSGTSGTSGTGGGKGLLGGLTGGGGGGSTSGTTSSTTSSGSVTNLCAQATDVCDKCGCSQCPSEVQGCFEGSPACGAIIECAGKCTDDNCVGGCVTSRPTGKQALDSLLGCLENKCASPCELTPSASSSGGSSGTTSGGSSTSGGTTSGAPPPPAG